MDTLSLLLMAVGLAMDAFAVSVASGMTVSGIRNSHALMLGAFFGGFQAIMPTVGWLAGLSLKDYITAYDHWIAFAILVFLGGKMVYESKFLRSEKSDDKADRCPRTLDIATVLALSVATSIDALAVGVTFAFLNVTIVAPVLVIGAVTFSMSYAGVHIGKRFCNFPSDIVEVVGGLILAGIGVKILVTHLMGGQ